MAGRLWHPYTVIAPPPQAASLAVRLGYGLHELHAFGFHQYPALLGRWQGSLVMLGCVWTNMKVMLRVLRAQTIPRRSTLVQYTATQPYRALPAWRL